MYRCRVEFERWAKGKKFALDGYFEFAYRSINTQEAWVVWKESWEAVIDIIAEREIAEPDGKVAK